MTKQQIHDLFILGIVLSLNPIEIIKTFVFDTEYQIYELITNIRKF